MLISSQLDDLVVPGRAGREDFRDPVGRAPQASTIDSSAVAQDEEIGLHDRAAHLARLVRLRQPHVERGDVDAIQAVFEGRADLLTQFADQHLVNRCRRRRLTDVESAIGRFLTRIIRPSQVLTVGVMGLVGSSDFHWNLRTGS